MRRSDGTPGDTIDRTESKLATVVDGLRSDGTITDDDADEFRHRIEALAADLDGCTAADRRR